MCKKADTKTFYFNIILRRFYLAFILLWPERFNDLMLKFILIINNNIPHIGK